MATLIQEYMTAMIQRLLIESKAIAKLEHRATKGTYRELFVQSLLRPILSSQFGIGSGIIVNQTGVQSPQQDVILYDTRLLPPFIAAGGLGVFPIESVVGTIEVKSVLTREELLKAEHDAACVAATAESGSIYSIYSPLSPPLAFVIGFESDCWLKVCNDESCCFLSSLTRLWSICCVGSYSWLKQECWELSESDENYRETKRFVAVMLDNIRSRAESNYRASTEAHRDWFSVYIRDDSSGARYLSGAAETWSGTTSPY